MPPESTAQPVSVAQNLIETRPPAAANPSNDSHGPEPEPESETGPEPDGGRKAWRESGLAAEAGS